MKSAPTRYWAVLTLSNNEFRLLRLATRSFPVIASRVMFKRFMNRDRRRVGNVCFCTLAIHAPYRERARVLMGDARGGPWVVLTDEPGDFEGLKVRAIRHEPTGPMAVDFLTKLPPTGTGRPAYHDKRFVLQAALREFETAIFVDADTRIRSLPELPRFPPGIAVTRAVEANIAEHLSRWGTQRKPVFEELACTSHGHDRNT